MAGRSGETLLVKEGARAKVNWRTSARGASPDQGLRRNNMRAYIECISVYAGGVVWGSVLHDSDLVEIGEFTRGNIERWLASYGGPCIECCGVQDFHAVCGEIDIPWREEINAQEYKRLNPPLATARWR